MDETTTGSSSRFESNVHDESDDSVRCCMCGFSKRQNLPELPSPNSQGEGETVLSKVRETLKSIATLL